MILLYRPCLVCALLSVVATTGSCRKPSPTGNTARVTMRTQIPRRLPLQTVRPQRPDPPVALQLRSATVTWSTGTLIVECRVTLVNRTGRDLISLTHFNTVFDGFTVIVRGPHGGLVTRQGYTWHQSPYAMDRPLPVVPGETAGTLRFPIQLKAKPMGPLEVQLSGGVRGTRWARSLQTNVVVARFVKSR